MIERATYADVDSISQLVVDFFGDSLADVGISPDFPSTQEFVFNMLGRDDMAIFIEKGHGELFGCIAGFVHPWQFNRNIIVLEEIGWFVCPSHRETATTGARLYLALTRWGKSLGAQSVIISSNIRAESEKVCAFYARIGARLTDKTFIGRL